MPVSRTQDTTSLFRQFDGKSLGLLCQPICDEQNQPFRMDIPDQGS
jgi:hypothetical protein